MVGGGDYKVIHEFRIAWRISAAITPIVCKGQLSQ